MNKEAEENIRIAKEILEDEINGDVQSALKKMTDDYSMTWVYKHPKTSKLIPKVKTDVSKEMTKVYVIKDRKYDIKNITANEKVVMIEMVESYTDPETKKLMRTPQVIVLEFRDGKISKGRHYCDPNLSYLDLDDQTLESIY